MGGLGIYVTICETFIVLIVQNHDPVSLSISYGMFRPPAPARTMGQMGKDAILKGI